MTMNIIIIEPPGACGGGGELPLAMVGRNVARA